MNSESGSRWKWSWKGVGAGRRCSFSEAQPSMAGLPSENTRTLNFNCFSAHCSAQGSADLLCCSFFFLIFSASWSCFYGDRIQGGVSQKGNHLGGKNGVSCFHLGPSFQARECNLAGSPVVLYDQHCSLQITLCYLFQSNFPTTTPLQPLATSNLFSIPVVLPL